MLVKVTQEDIDFGGMACNNCPIAKVLLSKFEDVMVMSDHIDLYFNNKWIRFAINDDVRAWIYRYDKSFSKAYDINPPEPFEFELEV